MKNSYVFRYDQIQDNTRRRESQVDDPGDSLNQCFEDERHKTIDLSIKPNKRNHNGIRKYGAGLTLIKEQNSLSHKSLPESPTRKIQDENKYPTGRSSGSNELSREFNIGG